MNLKNAFATFIIVSATTLTAQADALFSYSDLTEEPAVWGTKMKETFDVAVRLTDPAAVGMTVTGLDVPMFQGTGIEDITMWLSTSLEIKNKKIAPDIVQVPVEITDERLTVAFPEGYTVPEGGLYAGYSFTISETDCQANQKPIALTYGRNPNGFMLHSTRSYLSWMEMSTYIGGLSMLAIKIDAGQQQKWSFQTPQTLDAQSAATHIEVPLTLLSVGTPGTETITFEYSFDTQAAATINMAAPAGGNAQLLYPYNETLLLPNNLDEGAHTLTLAITSPNASESRQIPVYIYDQAPQRNVLMEEYTGLWCAWCPKGYVALEKMAGEPGFIGVAIHNRDAMAVLATDDYPNPAPSLPTGWVDRTMEVEPSYANVRAAWEQRRALFTPAATSVEGSFDPASGTVALTGSVSFIRPASNPVLPFFYVLADGLTDRTWIQANAFSGKELWMYPDMEQFINASSNVTGLVFNDVLVACTSPKGMADSFIPETPVPGTLYSSEALFNVAEMKGTDGYELGKNAASFKGVFGVVDSVTGEVLNVASCTLPTAAIGGVDAETVATYSLDLLGNRIANNNRGLHIEVTEMADGTRKVTKKMK